jgi:hypothetical protein
MPRRSAMSRSLTMPVDLTLRFKERYPTLFALVMALVIGAIPVGIGLIVLDANIDRRLHKHLHEATVQAVLETDEVFDQATEVLNQLLPLADQQCSESVLTAMREAIDQQAYLRSAFIIDSQRYVCSTYYGPRNVPVPPGREIDRELQLLEDDSVTPTGSAVIRSASNGHQRVNISVHETALGELLSLISRDFQLLIEVSGLQLDASGKVFASNLTEDWAMVQTLPSSHYPYQVHAGLYEVRRQALFHMERRSVLGNLLFMGTLLAGGVFMFLRMSQRPRPA